MSLGKKLLYSPLQVHMVVTRRCNLACRYCNESDTRSPPVPRAQLERQIRKLRELGTLSLVMTGGEPLLHPDLLELVRYAKRYIPMVGLLTNGFLLTEGIIISLNHSRLDALQISVDGVFPNETTVKVLAHLEEKLFLLAEYARFKVVVSSVVGATDSREMMAVFDLCSRLNLVATVSVVHDGNGQFNLTENGREEYAYANGARIKPIWDGFQYQRELLEKGEYPFKCRCGSRYLYLDEYGKVQWCSQQRGVLDKALADYSFDDLRTQFYTHKSCSAKCTLNCARKASSLDGWRKQQMYP